MTHPATTDAVGQSAPAAEPSHAGDAPDGPLSILVVISQYPPHHRGGYELRCRDVCRELARRGHRVTVLTSRRGARGTEQDEGVRVVRELHLWPDGVPNGARSVAQFTVASGADCRRLRRELKQTGAQVLAFWHQSGLTSALLAVRPPRGCGVLCDVSSEWLLDAATTGGNWFRIWSRRAPTPAKRAAKALAAPFARALGSPTERPRLPPGRAYFTSADRKQRYVEAGVDVEDASLVRSGVDLERFTFRGDRPATGPRTVLFLSRIKRWKGLHTAIRAIGHLPDDVHLQVFGAVDEPEYLAEITDLVRTTNVAPRVRLEEQIPHAQIPDTIRSAHALVFCSEEPEPFSRLVLEAFACGTPVVGTTIGGTGEVLVDGETGLTYEPGDARQLAAQLARVLSDAPLRDRLVANARTLVETRYGLGSTVTQIEALLREAHASADAARLR